MMNYFGTMETPQPATRSLAEVEAQRQQRELQKQQIDANKRSIDMEEQNQAAARDRHKLMTAAAAGDPEAMKQWMISDPEGAQKYATAKSTLEKSAAEEKARKERAEAVDVYAFLRDVKDDAGYQEARNALKKRGHDIDDMPETFSPSVGAFHRASGQMLFGDKISPEDQKMMAEHAAGLERQKISAQGNEARKTEGVKSGNDFQLEAFRQGNENNRLAATLQQRQQSDAMQYSGQGGLTPSQTRNAVASTRKEFKGLQQVKDYEATLPLLVSARKAPNTPAGDLQVIYTVGKVLDPGSVVREGELTLTQNATPYVQKLIGQVNKQMKGEGGLTPQSRKALLDMLNERVLSYRQGYDQVRSQYGEYSSQLGLKPEMVVGKHAADAYGSPQTGKPSQSKQSGWGKAQVVK